MSLEIREVLPDIYVPENQEYQRIVSDVARSTMGEATFTNPNTLIEYTTVGTVYEGQGEHGLALLLFNIRPILKNYIYDLTIHEDIKNSIEQSIGFATLTSGTSPNISITTKSSDDRKFSIEVTTTITGGDITINRNTTGALDLFSDYAMTTNVTELTPDVYDFVDMGTGFIIMPKSSGGGSGSMGFQPFVRVTSTDDTHTFTVLNETYIIPWDSEIEKDSGFTHSNVTNNTRLYVDETGSYNIGGTVYVESESQRGAFELEIFINGVTIGFPTGSSYIRNSSSWDLWSCVIANKPLKLNVGDYVEIQAKLVNGTNGTIYGTKSDFHITSLKTYLA